MSKAAIEYSTRAVEQLEALETQPAERIIEKLDDAAWKPDHYLKRMTGSEYYSCRAGDYRAIVDWRKNETPEILFIRRVGHRKNVYG